VAVVSGWDAAGGTLYLGLIEYTGLLGKVQDLRGPVFTPTRVRMRIDVDDPAAIGRVARLFLAAPGRLDDAVRSPVFETVTFETIAPVGREFDIVGLANGVWRAEALMCRPDSRAMDSTFNPATADLRVPEADIVRIDVTRRSPQTHGTISAKLTGWRGPGGPVIDHAAPPYCLLLDEGVVVRSAQVGQAGTGLFAVFTGVPLGAYRVVAIVEGRLSDQRVVVSERQQLSVSMESWTDAPRFTGRVLGVDGVPLASGRVYARVPSISSRSPDIEAKFFTYGALSEDGRVLGGLVLPDAIDIEIVATVSTGVLRGRLSRLHVGDVISSDLILMH